MKQKINWLSCLFLLLLLGISACQQEDEAPQEIPGKESRMVASIDELPEVGRYLLEGLDLKQDGQLFSVNQGDAQLPLKIDWEQIYQLVDANGKETYTFRITDYDGDIATFYNLVLKVSENGEPLRPFLMKYTMTEDFVQTYLQTGSLEGFTGTRQRIYLNANRNNSNGGSSAWLDDTLGGGGLDADPCPEENLGGGSSSGDLGQGSICRTYEVTTYWYSQTVGNPPVLVDVTVTYRTECGPGEGTAAYTETDCRPVDEEVPMLDELPEELQDNINLFVKADYQESGNNRKIAKILSYLRYSRQRRDTTFKMEDIFTNMPDFGPHGALYDIFSGVVSFDGREIPITRIGVPLSSSDVSEIRTLYYRGSDVNTSYGARYNIEFIVPCGGCAFPRPAFTIQVMVSDYQFLLNWLNGN